MFPQYIPDWNNPNSTLIKRKETELRVDFKSSGGQIYVFGSDRPDLMRGPNPQGVVLDEFAYMKPQVWDDIIQPIMRANPKAWCWFISTPAGKNHFFRVFQFGQRKDTEWKSWQLTINDSGIFTPEQIRNAERESLPQAWQQEYLCDFLEGEGSVFRGVREVMRAIPEKPQEGHQYVMGVDLAKHKDYTVIAVYDRANNAQVYQERFNQLEYVFQKVKIKEISKHYNNASIVIDSTGLGEPIYDDLSRANIPVQGIKITQPLKKDLVEKLSQWIQMKRIRMLPIEETTFEFDNFRYEVGPTGLLKYGAPEGFNDDIVIAHALAIWSLTPLYIERAEPGKTRIQQEYERRMRLQYGEQEAEFGEWEQF